MKFRFEAKKLSDNLNVVVKISVYVYDSFERIGKIHCTEEEWTVLSKLIKCNAIEIVNE